MINRRVIVSSQYREDKAIEVASLFLKKEGGRINYTKLIKLMYVLEREAILKWGVPVTCDDYYSLDNGPILSNTLDNITGKTYTTNTSSTWEDYIVREGYDVILQNSPPLLKLNRAEVSLIDDIYSRLGHLTYGQLIDWVHDPQNVPEWRHPQGSRFPIQLKTILKNGDYTDSNIKAVIADIEHAQSARERFAI